MRSYFSIKFIKTVVISKFVFLYGAYRIMSLTVQKNSPNEYSNFKKKKRNYSGKLKTFDKTAPPGEG